MSAPRIGDWRREWRAQQAREESAFFWCCMGVAAGLFVTFVLLVSHAYAVQS